MARASRPGVFRVAADFSLAPRLERRHRRTQDLLRRPLRAPGEKRLFEQVADPGEELGGGGAVEDAVVAGEVDPHQVGGGDLAVADDRALLDRADGEDRRLRRVDHGA